MLFFQYNSESILFFNTADQWFASTSIVPVLFLNEFYYFCVKMIRYIYIKVRLLVDETRQFQFYNMVIYVVNKGS